MNFWGPSVKLHIERRFVAATPSLSPQDLESRTFCLRVHGLCRNGKLSLNKFVAILSHGENMRANFEA
jgi:hypothetical protein